MLQARIVSKRGSLYFAAEATPYDLENLRTHIRDLQSSRTKDVQLELTLDQADDPPGDCMSAWLRRLAADGVKVRVSPSVAPTTPPPYKAVRPSAHR